jgi:hypothetical protein
MISITVLAAAVGETKESTVAVFADLPASALPLQVQTTVGAPARQIADDAVSKISSVLLLPGNASEAKSLSFIKSGATPATRVDEVTPPPNQASSVVYPLCPTIDNVDFVETALNVTVLASSGLRASPPVQVSVRVAPAVNAVSDALPS